MNQLDNHVFKIICITTNEDNLSCFKEIHFHKNERGGMFLTDQIGAKNFRIRESDPGYITDWHMSGDPTMIIIQKGILRITLPNGEFKDFKAGDEFIAADNLPLGIEFINGVHGHKAEVIGGKSLKAVHIKLGGFEGLVI
jgi:hypothetical protein